MPTRQIYLLTSRELSPESIAVTFAKTSRSPESFRKIAADLNDERSTRFHEKWVVGYGHSSVAEHAVLHIAIENVSRLAVESIESNRLASYTEKSTRYQKWDSQAFFIPSELENRLLINAYTQACEILFQTYLDSIQSMRHFVENQSPRLGHESEEAYDRRIRSLYVDSCRFLLPSAALANLGMTINARSLEHTINKMLSHPLSEVRQIGEQIRQVAQNEVPTLVKYAAEIPYLQKASFELSNNIQALSLPASMDRTNWCRLISYDPDGENKVLAAALYRFGHFSYTEALYKVHSATEGERLKVSESVLGQMRAHDTPMRELEHTFYTFDLVLDQGGYAEFKRHRMMTQSPQSLTTHLGYAVPRLFSETNLEARYHSAMQAAIQTYEKLAEWNPHVAAYVVPNGFNRRVLFTMNLREAFAFCQLRSASNAHYSMRRVAQRVGELIREVHPLLARFMSMPDETWQDIERNNFIQT